MICSVCCNTHALLYVNPHTRLLDLVWPQRAGHRGGRRAPAAALSVPQRAHRHTTHHVTTFVLVLQAADPVARVGLPFLLVPILGVALWGMHVM